MSEYDLDSETSATSAGPKKYNFKELFMSLQEGDNVMRIVSKKGKSAQTQWVKDTEGGWKSVKLPEDITPSTQKRLAEKGAGKVEKKNFVKVVDSFGKMKILEFGKLISKGLKKIQDGLKEDDKDIINIDINIKKGPKKANPLYEVVLAKIDQDEKALRDKAIKRLVEADEIVLSDIIKPWSEKRIRETIFGDKDEPESSSYDSDESEDEEEVEVSDDDAFADMEKE